MAAFNQHAHYFTGRACDHTSGAKATLRKSRKAATASTWTDSGCYEDAGVEVDTITVDEASKHAGNIHILKIDVDGGEMAVLQGATQTLRKTKVVLVEVNDIRLLLMLKGAAKYSRIFTPDVLKSIELFDWSTVDGCNWIGERKP